MSDAIPCRQCPVPTACTLSGLCANWVHCWEDGPRTDDDCGTTCMLPRDHNGPHEWTRDDEIMLSFAPDEGEASDG